MVRRIASVFAVSLCFSCSEGGPEGPFGNGEGGGAAGAATGDGDASGGTGGTASGDSGGASASGGADGSGGAASGGSGAGTNWDFEDLPGIRSELSNHQMLGTSFQKSTNYSNDAVFLYRDHTGDPNLLVRASETGTINSYDNGHVDVRFASPSGITVPSGRIFIAAYRPWEENGSQLLAYSSETTIAAEGEIWGNHDPVLVPHGEDEAVALAVLDSGDIVAVRYDADENQWTELGDVPTAGEALVATRRDVSSAWFVHQVSETEWALETMEPGAADEANVFTERDRVTAPPCTRSYRFERGPNDELLVACETSDVLYLSFLNPGEGELSEFVAVGDDFEKTWTFSVAPSGEDAFVTFHSGEEGRTPHFVTVDPTGAVTDIDLPYEDWMLNEAGDTGTMRVVSRAPGTAEIFWGSGGGPQQGLNLTVSHYDAEQGGFLGVPRIVLSDLMTRGPVGLLPDGTAYFAYSVRLSPNIEVGLTTIGDEPLDALETSYCAQACDARQEDDSCPEEWSACFTRCVQESAERTYFQHSNCLEHERTLRKCEAEASFQCVDETTDRGGACEDELNEVCTSLEDLLAN